MLGTAWFPEMLKMEPWWVAGRKALPKMLTPPCGMDEFSERRTTKPGRFLFSDPRA